jgi:hypothetical protein
MKKYILVALLLVATPQLSEASALSNWWGKLVSLFHRPAVTQTVSSLTVSQNKEIVCPTDTKLCPDGSYIGRTGPKCEFKACSSGEKFEKKDFSFNEIQSIDYANQILYLPPNFFRSNVPNPNNPIKIRTNKNTTIRDLRNGDIISFSQLRISDPVYIRAYGSGLEEGQGDYYASQVFVVNEGSSRLFAVRGKNEGKGTILTLELLSGKPEVGPIISSAMIIPDETLIKKGRPEEGTSRPIIDASKIEIGDIFSGFISGRFDCGSDGCLVYDEPYYLINMDIVKPYYCEDTYQPRGCVKK